MKEFDKKSELTPVVFNNLSRRSFLKGALAVGGALALAGCGDNSAAVKTVTVTETKTVTVVEPGSAPTVPDTLHELPDMLMGASYILPDYARCTGCQKCMIACSVKHCGTTDMYLSNIQVYSMNIKGAYVDIPVLCMKCRDNPCVKSCPEKVQALTVNTTTGAIIVDHEKCTLCGNCIEACQENRAGVLRLSRDEERLVGLCNMCDGNPACVLACPDDVLQIVSKSGSIDGKNFAKKPEVLGQQIWDLLFHVE